MIRVPILAAILLTLLATARSRGDVTAEQVERAIRRGADFLKTRQRGDGAWPGDPGVTALVSLALVTAGEKPDSPAVDRAFRFLLQAPEGHHETYSLGLKAMALASAPEKYARAIQSYADRLEQSQLRAPLRVSAGGWTYQRSANGMGLADNSNSQYALLGLHAASEAGARVDPVVFLRALHYWQVAQGPDGGWSYQATQRFPTGSMTCAGVSSLIIAGARQSESRERLAGGLIERCGERQLDPGLQAGLDWLARHFDVRANFNSGGQWKYYYLYGLERAGRLSGLRYFGRHDWYREGAEELVRLQDPITGTWRGVGQEGDPVIATSFALLFLAKGRSPVLVNKLRHGPAGDWDNDHDDMANLTAMVSRDWKALVTWQVVDPNQASVEDLLQAPIAYLNGHHAPILGDDARRSLRRYIENGGLILAEACCGRKAFDEGFRTLIREILPEPDYDLHPLPPEHPIWRSKYELDPNVHPLWGIEHGCRTVVIYSPGDLSCYWHHLEAQPGHPRVIQASRIGQNIIDYVTGRELPADKLAARAVDQVGVDLARRGALYIAKIKHGGDWNVAPLAIPNLTTSLRDKLKLDVVINHKEMTLDDPNLVNFPLVYLHGRGAATFTDEQVAALRRHLTPGGGTLFADAACGAEAFDAAFRKLAAELFPGRPLEVIPPTDDFFARPAGFDLSDAELNKAAGGRKGFPQLEGVKVDGHWAIIYSKYDLGCSLERHAGIDCKGYTHESAVRIAANIVVYATMP